MIEQYALATISNLSSWWGWPVCLRGWCLAEAQGSEVDAEARRDAARQPGGEHLSDRRVAEGGDGRVVCGESASEVGRDDVPCGTLEPAEAASGGAGGVGLPRVRDADRQQACEERRGVRVLERDAGQEQIERFRPAADRGEAGGASAERDPDAGKRRAGDLIGAPARGAARGHRHHRGL